MKTKEKDIVLRFINNVVIKPNIEEVIELHPGCLSIKTDTGWYRLKYYKSDNEVCEDKC